MKRILLFFVVLLCFINLSACATSDVPVLTDSLKEQMEADWAANNFGAKMEWTDETDTYGRKFRYYGEIGEYHVLFSSYNIMHIAVVQDSWAITIGDSFFDCPYPFMLFAYKDGKFQDIVRLYDEGVVDDAFVAQVAEVHAVYQAKFPLKEAEE